MHPHPPARATRHSQYPYTEMQQQQEQLGMMKIQSLMLYVLGGSYKVQENICTCNPTWLWTRLAAAVPPVRHSRSGGSRTGATGGWCPYSRFVKCQRTTKDSFGPFPDLNLKADTFSRGQSWAAAASQFHLLRRELTGLQEDNIPLLLVSTVHRAFNHLCFQTGTLTYFPTSSSSRRKWNKGAWLGGGKPIII